LANSRRAPEGHQTSSLTQRFDWPRGNSIGAVQFRAEGGFQGLYCGKKSGWPAISASRVFEALIGGRPIETLAGQHQAVFEGQAPLDLLAPQLVDEVIFRLAGRTPTYETRFS
jgi:hypothetical protein